MLFDDFQTPKTSAFYEVKTPEEELNINNLFEDCVNINNDKETSPEITNSLESRMNKHKSLIEVYSKKLTMSIKHLKH